MTVSQNHIVGSLDFLRSFGPGVAIGAGLVDGISVETLRGSNADIDRLSLPETMWPGSNLYPFPAGAFTAHILSDNAADDSPSGTGALTVRVDGLDTNYVEKSEVITMNGVAEVASTDSDWFRINHTTVLTVGSAGENVGTISVLEGTGGTVISIMEPQFGRSRSGHFTANASCNAAIIGGVVNLLQSGGGAEMDIIIFTRTDSGPWLGVDTISVRASGSSSVHLSLSVPQVLPPKTDFDIRIVFADSNNMHATMDVEIILVDTDLITIA